MEQLLPLVNNTPYVWWCEGETTATKPTPFYCRPTDVPNLDFVKANGANCAGLLNLLSHIKGSTVPGLKANLWNAGGTYVWHDYLASIGVLEPFDPTKSYPKGTLILRRYEDVENQGHVAIIYSEPSSDPSHTVLDQQLFHSYPDAGVAIDAKVKTSHDWHPAGYYEFAVPNWFSTVYADPEF
jgi:hypothetical protein